MSSSLCRQCQLSPLPSPLFHSHLCPRGVRQKRPGYQTGSKTTSKGRLKESREEEYTGSPPYGPKSLIFQRSFPLTIPFLQGGLLHLRSLQSLSDRPGSLMEWVEGVRGPSSVAEKVRGTLTPHRQLHQFLPQFAPTFWTSNALHSLPALRFPKQ